MKKILNESDLATKGKVSIWVGDFRDEERILDYLEDPRGMGADFGCVLSQRRELIVSINPKPLRHLLEGFSHWEDFIEEAVSGNEDLTCRCAVVAYASDYTRVSHVRKETKLKFLTVANFGPKERPTSRIW